jgi:two-component system OmpR family response regulator
VNDPVRVLVVDDEADIRTIVGLNLDLLGITYAEAVDGTEAIEMLRSDSWDACVLDLAMPGEDGFAVLKDMATRGQLDDTVVIVLSALASPSSAIEALELGAHTHLVKPFSPAAVARIVREFIGLPPAERAERREQSKERAATLARLGVPTV